MREYAIQLSESSVGDIIMAYCTLCGYECNNIITKETRKMIRHFYNCEQCGLIFRDKSEIVSSDQERKRYLLHRNSFRDKKYVEWLKQIIEEVKKIVDFQGCKILDYGCGHTPVFPKILKEYYAVNKVDLYDIYFYKNLDGEKRYDCIFSIEVFEHFHQVRKEVEKVLFLLNKRGYLILVTNFHNQNETDFLRWWYISDITHTSFYSEKTLQFITSSFHLKLLYCNQKNIAIFQK